MRSTGVLIGLIGCVLAPALRSAEPVNVNDLVSRSFEANRRNQASMRCYSYRIRTEEIEPGKPTDSKTFEMSMLEGSPVRRLVAINDKPLSPEEERTEQERLRKIASDRKNHPEKRAADLKAKEQKEREFHDEILKAFDFRLAGSERLGERDCWIVEGTPRAGYTPSNIRAEALPHMRGKLWIDKQDYNWAKLEAEAVDTVSFGFMLARMDKGAHFLIENTRLPSGVWLPKTNEIRANARIALVKHVAINQKRQYDGYRPACRAAGAQ